MSSHVRYLVVYQDKGTGDLIAAVGETPVNLKGVPASLRVVYQLDVSFDIPDLCECCGQQLPKAVNG